MCVPCVQVSQQEKFLEVHFHSPCQDTKLPVTTLALLAAVHFYFSKGPLVTVVRIPLSQTSLPSPTP